VSGLGQDIQLAFGLHQLGKIQEAIQAYEELLRKDAKNFDAHHMLGVALSQAGDDVRAITHLLLALDIKNGDPLLLDNLTLVYQRSGQPGAVVKLLDKGPEWTSLRFSTIERLAWAYKELSLDDGMARIFGYLCDLYPDTPELERLLESCCVYFLRSRNPSVVIQQLGSLSRRAPLSVVLLVKLVSALRMSGRSYEAAQLIGQLVPDVIEAHAPLYREWCSTKTDAGDFSGAEILIQRAKQRGLLTLDEIDMLRIELGIKQHQYTAIVDILEQALFRNPLDLVLLVNAGVTQQALGDVEKARAYYEKALSIQPTHHPARFNLSLIELAEREFFKGWEHYESRWFAPGFQEKRFQDIPPFKLGEGRKILAWSEQGLGDQILFLSYLNLSEWDHYEVIVDPDTKLRPIISRIIPQKNVRLLQNTESLADIDGQVSFGSLPFCLGSKPDFCSYPERARPSKFGKRLRVGICWGSKNQKIGAQKSIQLGAFLECLPSGHLEVVNLQYDSKPEDETFLSATLGPNYTANTVDRLNDLAALIHLIESCDVVVTTSNTNAHLSGMLGVRTYVLLPKDVGLLWYWGYEGETCPWYESVRLVRNQSNDSWGDSLKKINLVLQNALDGTC